MSEFRVKLERDNDAESPRDWDNLGTMACWHNRYNLGDVQPGGEPLEHKANVAGVDLESFDDYWENAGYRSLMLTMNYEQACKEIFNKRKDKIEKAFDAQFISLPLYLYDHSGITMSTSSFSCRWDSGQVGFIYVSIADVKKEYSWKTLTKERREKVVQYLIGEVETYDQYLTGDVWGYTVEEYGFDEDGDEVVIEEHDSCWGCYGEDYARKEGESMIEAAKKQSEVNTNKRMNVVAQMGV